jgi:transposase
MKATVTRSASIPGFYEKSMIVAGIQTKPLVALSVSSPGFKQFRRIATSYYKLAVRFAEFICIASSFIWLV